MGYRFCWLTELDKENIWWFETIIWNDNLHYGLLISYLEYFVLDAMF